MSGKVIDFRTIAVAGQGVVEQELFGVVETPESRLIARQANLLNQMAEMFEASAAQMDRTAHNLRLAAQQARIAAGEGIGGGWYGG